MAKIMDDFSGTLRITLDEEPVEISPDLYNQKALPIAKILDVKLELTNYDAEAKEDDDIFPPISEEQMEEIVYPFTEINLSSFGSEKIKHKSLAEKGFTLREMIQAIEKTELLTRADSEWFGGIDVHHVFFEGIHDGEICWGS